MKSEEKEEGDYYKTNFDKWMQKCYDKDGNLIE
jgi:hypothetical protein